MNIEHFDFSKVVFRIEGRVYKAVDDVPRKGNRVIDLRDGQHTRIQMKHKKVPRVAIGNNHCTEVGVPITKVKVLRLIKKSSQ